MPNLTLKQSSTSHAKLPSWFQQDLPDMKKIRKIKASLQQSGLHTVCESARCPNMGQCWEQNAVTFMILGDVCTRSCRFCAVKTGMPVLPDPQEPEKIAKAVRKADLNYVVVTSVTRDDLKDGGAEQFAQTIQKMREYSPQTGIEVLIPDFFCCRESLAKVASTMPTVMAHNIETVERLTPHIRPQADYQRSLNVLRMIKEIDPTMITKSGLMVGLGETFAEMEQTMHDLRKSGCDLLTIGQYLCPSDGDRHVSVKRFVPPEEFRSYKILGEKMGFRSVMSGPLVRSSFLAEKEYQKVSDSQKLMKGAPCA